MFLLLFFFSRASSSHLSRVFFETELVFGEKRKKRSKNTFKISLSVRARIQHKAGGGIANFELSRGCVRVRLIRPATADDFYRRLVVKKQTCLKTFRQNTHMLHKHKSMEISMKIKYILKRCIVYHYILWYYAVLKGKTITGATLVPKNFDYCSFL